MNETLRTLRERRSVRSFLPDPIPESILDAILEAGTWAATGMNQQSPVMVVVRDKETIDYMERLNAAVMGNPDGHPFYGAPLVVVVLAGRAVVPLGLGAAVVEGGFHSLPMAVVPLSSGHRAAMATATVMMPGTRYT